MIPEEFTISAYRKFWKGVKISEGISGWCPKIGCRKFRKILKNFLKNGCQYQKIKKKPNFRVNWTITIFFFEPSQKFQKVSEFLKSHQKLPSKFPKYSEVLGKLCEGKQSSVLFIDDNGTWKTKQKQNTFALLLYGKLCNRSRDDGTFAYSCVETIQMSTNRPLFPFRKNQRFKFCLNLR
jgi:hypothetical protein